MWTLPPSLPPHTHAHAHAWPEFLHVSSLVQTKKKKTYKKIEWFLCLSFLVQTKKHTHINRTEKEVANMKDIWTPSSFLNSIPPFFINHMESNIIMHSLQPNNYSHIISIIGEIPKSSRYFHDNKKYFYFCTALLFVTKFILELFATYWESMQFGSLSKVTSSITSYVTMFTNKNHVFFVI